jgi:hypothetical protein
MRKGSILLALPTLLATACKPPTQSVVESRGGDESLLAMANLEMDEAVAVLESEQLVEEPMNAAAAFRWDGDVPASSGEAGSMALTGAGGNRVWGGIASLWQKNEKNYCKILAPYLLKGAQMWQRPYLALGVSAQAGAAIQQAVGRDFVWDLYNLQFAVFDYSQTSGVIGSGMLGSVSANAYGGLGFGVRTDVKSAWEGYFMGGSAEMGLPLPVLSNIFSGSVHYFTGASKNAHGKIVADTSFVGAAAGASAGLSSPGAGSVSGNIGFWTLNKKLTNSMAAKFKNFGIPASAQGTQSCEGQCVRFDAGTAKASYTKRALNLARSLPVVVSLPPNMNLVQVGLLALSVGAMRDHINGAQSCLKTVKN